MKTLVIRTGGVGDTILTLSAARWLKNREEDVTVMAHGEYADIVRRFGFGFIPYDGCDFESAFSDPSEKLMITLAPFNAVIAIKSDLDGSMTKGLARAASGSVVRIEPLPPPGYTKHYTRFLVDSIAAALGLDPPEVVPRPASDVLWKPAGEQGLVVHPGSGSKRKNWPRENLSSVIESRLENREGRVTLILGPAEDDAADFFSRMSDRVRVARNLRLGDVFKILSGSQAYLGMDSGITHIAATAGAPVVALFGPTDPAVWGPDGERTRIIKSSDGRMDSIGVDEVLEALESWR